MTFNCGDICIAVTICSIFTILLYIASWLSFGESDEKQDKKSNTSDTDTRETKNDKSMLPRESSQGMLLDKIANEKSDVEHLADKDLLASNMFEPTTKTVSAHQEYVDKPLETGCNLVVQSNGEPRRFCLRLLIRYDNETGKLMVQILENQYFIKSNRSPVSEIRITFSLIGPYCDTVEKYSRTIVGDEPMSSKAPVEFDVTFQNAVQNNLYVYASSSSNSNDCQDLEISIPLNSLDSESAKINEWFDLQDAQTSY